MLSLTNPFNFNARRRFAKATGTESIALLDAFLICLLLVTLSSRFFLTPGLSVNLPKTHQGISTELITSVLTLKRDGKIIHRGRFLNFKEFQKALESEASSIRASKKILLIKADAEVTLDAFLRVAELAREAGYARVQIAQRAHLSEEP